MPLVFQYGSNVSTPRLNGPERLQGTAEVVGLARTVEPYRLSLDAETRGGWAAANLVRKGKLPAYGVLYRIPEERVFRGEPGGPRTLDEIEHESEIYRRVRLEVACETWRPESVEAWTYRVIRPRAELPTQWDYVRHILSGLVDHGAPRAYVELVEGIILDHQPDLAEPVRRWSESMTTRRKR